MFETVNFKSGQIRFCSESMDDEDILQVAFPNNYILDLGWYGKNGFILYIIRDMDWSVPLVEYHFLNEELAEGVLHLAIERIEKEIINSKPYYGSLWKTEKIVNSKIII